MVCHHVQVLESICHSQSLLPVVFAQTGLSPCHPETGGIMHPTKFQWDILIFTSVTAVQLSGHVTSFQVPINNSMILQ